VLSLIGSGLSSGYDADHIIPQGKDNGDNLIRHCPYCDQSGFHIAAGGKDKVVRCKDFNGIGEVNLVLVDIRRAFGVVP